LKEKTSFEHLVTSEKYGWCMQSITSTTHFSSSIEKLENHQNSELFSAEHFQSSTSKQTLVAFLSSSLYLPFPSSSCIF
jgi:hypothetical protein